MRHVTKLLLAVVLVSLLFATQLEAQSTRRPWLLNAGVNVIDFNAPYEFGDASKTEFWNTLPAISKLTLARNLNPSLALDLELGGSRITTVNGGEEIGAKGFVDGSLDLKYKFDNGYIINENAFFAPYIFAGVGVSYLSEEDVNPTLGGGLGFNFWFWKDFGAFIQSAYRYIPGGDETVVGDQNYLNHSLGVVVRFGKVDTDKDGIEDEEDACPELAGPVTTMGCPDRDNDGIADKTDACPDQAGPAPLNGCPDADADGLADKDDKCPSQKGTKELQGCPDRDADGVADNDDQCPDQKGTVALFGCPDSDGDGVADKSDICPTQKGLAQFQGCPDTDSDGVPDNKDKCQGLPGPASNAGCPVPKEEEIQKINLSAKSIQFQTGKDVITKQSYAVLDVIAEIMQQYPETQWSIEGHTDNVGDDTRNMDLSNRRAASVKKYFQDKGVSGSRMKSEGFGETKPLADNKTSAGKAQNRRVEIKLLTQ